MTEILLNAVLNLFAIQTSILGPEFRARARTIIARYMNEHLRISQCEIYLELFDAALELHDGSEKLTPRQQAKAIAATL